MSSKNISDKFFTIDATHNIKLFLSPGLEYNYEKGESTLTINNSTMIIKYGDGSGSTNKLSRAIIKVFGGDGPTVEEVAYFDEDRKDAYIAKMSQYGGIIVESYVYNHNVKSYVNAGFYGLY